MGNSFDPGNDARRLCVEFFAPFLCELHLDFPGAFPLRSDPGMRARELLFHALQVALLLRGRAVAARIKCRVRPPDRFDESGRGSFGMALAEAVQNENERERQNAKRERRQTETPREQAAAGEAESDEQRQPREPKNARHQQSQEGRELLLSAADFIRQLFHFLTDVARCFRGLGVRRAQHADK